MLLYLFIWEHFISRIIEYSFHKVTSNSNCYGCAGDYASDRCVNQCSGRIVIRAGYVVYARCKYFICDICAEIVCRSQFISLIAIRFYSCGNIMNNGGIAERIVNVAKVVAGRMPGHWRSLMYCSKHVIWCNSGSVPAAAAAMVVRSIDGKRKDMIRFTVPV